MKRIIGIVAVVLSLLLSATLVYVWIQSRSRDLLIHSTDNGSYREVRAARDGWGFMSASGWGAGSPKWRAQWVSNALLTDRDLLAMPSTETFNMTSPTRGGFWPVTHISGRGGTRFNTITFTGGSLSVSGTGSSTSTLKASNFRIATTTATMPALRTASGTVQVFTPSTMPSITTPAITIPSLSGAARPAKQSDDPLNLGSMSMTLKSTPPTTTLVVSTGVSTINITGGTLMFAPTYPFDRWVIPHWVLIVVTLAPGAVIGLLVLKRRRLRRWRLRTGLCVACGYDLRGGGDVCPECGNGAGAPLTSIG